MSRPDPRTVAGGTIDLMTNHAYRAGYDLAASEYADETLAVRQQAYRTHEAAQQREPFGTRLYYAHAGVLRWLIERTESTP